MNIRFGYFFRNSLVLGKNNSKKYRYRFLILMILFIVLAFSSIIFIGKKNDSNKKFLSSHGISYNDATHYCRAMGIDIEDFCKSRTLQAMYRRHGNEVVIVRKVVTPFKY